MQRLKAIVASFKKCHKSLYAISMYGRMARAMLLPPPGFTPPRANSAAALATARAWRWRYHKACLR